MSTTMTRAAYRTLIAENLAWLDEQPRSLEREHIRCIVKRSEMHEYGPETSPLPTPTQTEAGKTCGRRINPNAIGGFRLCPNLLPCVDHPETGR